MLALHRQAANSEPENRGENNVHSIAIKLLTQYGSFFLYLILGVVAMGLFWLYFPGGFVQLQRSSSTVRDLIAAGAWSPRAESIIRFVLDDNRVLLISFVLATRLALDLVVVAPIRALFGAASTRADAGSRSA